MSISSINSSGQPLFQIGGLASGLDTTSMITQLVQAERAPETQWKSQQTTLTNQKNDWMQINSLMSAFDTAMAQLGNVSTWTTNKASTSDSSVVSVSGSSQVQGSYNINIANLATQATYAVQGVSGTPIASNTVALKTQNFTGGLTVNTVDSSGTAHALTFDFNANTINGAAFSGSDPNGMSLNDVASAINNPVNGMTYGVTASVVQVSGGYALSITTNQTGSSSTVNTNTSITTTDPNLASGASSSTPVSISPVQAAQDANFSINNLAMTSSTNTVTGAIPGISLNLLKGNSTAAISLTTDTSAAESAVKNMVDSYNKLQDYIAQQMSYDSDKKTAGDLLGNSLLMSIQSQLRQKMGSDISLTTSGVDTTYNNLSQIGISTSSDNFGQSADLTFDTSKFEAALATNPKSVANMFGAPVGLTQNTMTDGLSNDMHNLVYPYIQYGGILSSQTDGLTSEITDLQDQIDSWEQHVQDYQTTLTQQFTAMETSLQQLQSQSSSFLSQMSSVQSSSSSK